jgi:hypothetical protein
MGNSFKVEDSNIHSYSPHTLHLSPRPLTVSIEEVEENVNANHQEVTKTIRMRLWVIMQLTDGGKGGGSVLGATQ